MAVDMRHKIIFVVDRVDRVDVPQTRDVWSKPLQQRLAFDAKEDGQHAKDYEAWTFVKPSFKGAVKATSWVYQQVKTQGKNDYDCGLHIAHALEEYVTHRTLKKLQFTDDLCTSMRRRLLKSILNNKIVI